MPRQEIDGLLDRLNGDAGFRARFAADIPAALTELELSHAHRMALVSTDEDALRRLSVAGQSEIEILALWSRIKRVFSRLFCGPGKTRSWECKKDPG